MTAIRLLSEATINRIAAGEVIERPAAAIKELVENALDAGAARITVAVDNGGIDRIEVVDDGIGMTAEELALAVLRHATSKLSDESLINIATLGFRGEALPSIGAAARLRITSRPRSSDRTPITDDHASTITVEGGAVSSVMPASGAAGTRVVVRDLFFATPARRKFLKNPRTEGDHAEAAVRRLAFAAPQVAFRLEVDGRVAFDLPSQTTADRVSSLLGPETAGALLPVDAERGTHRLNGFICSPAISRATAAGQGLTVNGRPVVDPMLRSAVRVAYRDVIVAGRHPIVALYLHCPSEELDVNVHPTKSEVRFRDAATVRSLIIGCVGRTLAGGAGTDMPAPGLMQYQPAGRRPTFRFTPQQAPQGGIQALPLPGFAPERPDREFHAAEQQLPFARAPAARVIAAAPADHDYPLGAPVAQVLDTYVIAVASDGSLVLIDQHAAHERLTHEAIRSQMLDGGVRSQPLLLPAVVDLSHAEASRLMAGAGDLNRLGLDIEAFGPGAILVRALPAALGSPDPAPLLRDLADQLAELEETTALAARLDAVIARLACHGSIRAGRRLTQAEMDALLRQMEATPRAATCSHGRPTFLKLSKADIETLFGRR
jgi:DNA mismatch repair protein MutL